MGLDLEHWVTKGTRVSFSCSFVGNLAFALTADRCCMTVLRPMY